MDRARRTSIAPLEKRRASNAFDRYRRQARNSVWYESAEGPSFDDPFGKGPNTQIRPPRRADTNLAPTDIHPGYRIPVPIEARIGSSPEEEVPVREGLARVQSAVQDADGKEWRSSGRKDTEHELSKIRAEIAGLPSSEHQTGVFRRALRKLKRSKSPDYAGLRGLRISVAGLAAHPSAALFLDAGIQRAKQRVFMADFMNVAESSAPRVHEFSRQLPEHCNRSSDIEDVLSKTKSAPALRVIYVQNDQVAMKYLSRAFSMNNSVFERSGKTFLDWATKDRTERGAAKKISVWRPSFDTDRDLICTAFGLEHSLASEKGSSGTKGAGTKSAKIKNLSSQIESYQRRFAVYLQRQVSEIPKGTTKIAPHKKPSSVQREFSGANTIIIYEAAPADSGDFVLSADPSRPGQRHINTSPIANGDDDEPEVFDIMEGVIGNVFERVLDVWNHEVALLDVQYSTLEDQIYERPSDDTHAGELWAFSKRVLEMEKLVKFHSILLEDVEASFDNFAERSEPSEWLEQTSKDFEQLGKAILDDFIVPTEHMIDLMYKSVSIRDARQSLELNMSLWRLSWITFIFLPLTFLVGFFGMNVRPLDHYPAMKWYFVSAVPLMFVVLLFYFVIRFALTRPTPSRGAL